MICLLLQNLQLSVPNAPIRIGPREFACPFCPKICGMKSHMEEHIRIHTGEKPFECPFCNYAANYKGNLKKHMISQHADHEKKFIKIDTVDISNATE